jgi:glycine hydroxymethyltransferase
LPYELFVHPTAGGFLARVVGRGQRARPQAGGLAARDSLRTEAGCRLRSRNGRPAQSHHGRCRVPHLLKNYKPFFVGREAFIQKEAARKAEIIRFRVPEKGQPKPQQLDRLVDEKAAWRGTSPVARWTKTGICWPGLRGRGLQEGGTALFLGDAAPRSQVSPRIAMGSGHNCPPRGSVDALSEALIR